MKFGKKWGTLSKKNLTVTLYTMKKYKNWNKLLSDFHDNKMKKQDSEYICLSAILLD